MNNNPNIMFRVHIIEAFKRAGAKRQGSSWLMPNGVEVFIEGNRWRTKVYLPNADPDGDSMAQTVCDQWVAVGYSTQSFEHFWNAVKRISDQDNTLTVAVVK